VAVLGASGYTGGELTRLLLDHPHVDLVLLSSERHDGRAATALLPSVRNHPGAAGLRLRRVEDIADVPDVDVALACLPTGELPNRMPLLAEHARFVVNLGGDFRLRGPDQARHYPASAARPAAFGYHIPEFGTPRPGQRFLNLPGCMAVASIYALYPLFAADLGLAHDVVIDAKTGSSGGGRAAVEHPADRIGNFRAHRLHGHRHGPEVRQAMADLTGTSPHLQFSTFSLDVARGIVVSAYTSLREGADELDVRRAYAKAYTSTPFVRVPRAQRGSPLGLPSLKSVVGSNVAEVGAQVHGTRCVTVTALDNLIKGAAGQAVQTMNQLFGLDQVVGLPFSAVGP
jgi:LysW-gamma-L-alpha-aminoadipyl-6-phosphate/LysW-L-glutamyl-5-phosphate reductase